MPFSPTPVAPATVKYVESQLKLFADFSGKALTGIEQLLELNLCLTRSALEQSALGARELLSVRQPKELMTLLSSQIEPSAQKALLYWRHVLRISTTTNAELAMVAERRFAHVSRTVGKLLGDMAIVPVAPAQVLSLMTHALDTAHQDHLLRRASDRTPIERTGETIDVEDLAVLQAAQAEGYAPAPR